MITLWSWWKEANNKQDELARSVLTVLVPALLLLWYRWVVFYSRKGTIPLPPGPYGLPVIGYLPFIGTNLFANFLEMGYKFGPISSLSVGTRLHVVVSSMDLVKVVARDLDQIFANRRPTLAAVAISYGGRNIVWSNKTYWRNNRRLLVSHVMSSANLAACQRFRTHEVRKMVNEVHTKIGEKININKIAFDTELNVVTSMSWGCSKSDEGNICDDNLDGFREIVSKIIKLLGAPNISDFIPMLSRFDLQGRQREMQKQREHLDRIFDNIIDSRINAKSRKTEGAVEEDGWKDFLQIMLELKEQMDTSTSFDKDQIKALLMDIMVAATDTTSTMVEWVMTEILHNPIVKRKVQDELTKVIGMMIVEESHLPKLKYLDAVIKETFRLHPPVPLLVQRSPDESCIVGGYTVPKDSIVYMNVWAIHRDPNNWPNPLEFKPERFLNGKWDYLGNNFKFLPFGSGRRICPGIPLGERMVLYILASLLHTFEWNLPENEEFDLSDKFGNVTKKRNALMAIPFRKRSIASFYK